MNNRPFLKRVVLKDYKSIGHCDVTLSQFTILVGPNGSGKSNWLDSLRFVAESLNNSLAYALRTRGGIKEVRRRSKSHPRHFGIRLELNLHDGSSGVYSFQVGTTSDGIPVVKREECCILNPRAPEMNCHYKVIEGHLESGSHKLLSAVEPDRLYLGVVSGVPVFRPLYDALTRMGFYNLTPAKIRDLQSPDPGDVLLREGENITSTLRRIIDTDPKIASRIVGYLEAIVPGLKGVGVKTLGPKETIEFQQEVSGDPNPLRFLASSMSDGTLRALGVLVALFQGALSVSKPVPLVGIEEPELALHPAAAGALVSGIHEASEHVQVILTSHSPDLLDNPLITPENILSVVADRGETRIGPVDAASREVLRKGLYTPGELLRLQQLEPAQAPVQPDKQLSFFDPQG